MALNSSIEPFHVGFPQADLDDLADRLARTRWPDEVPGLGWSHGAPVSRVRPLAEHWRTTFDWRAQERELNAFPQFTTEIDGQNVHFLHVRSPEPDALPVIVTHGWPSSPLEYLDVIGPLTDPRAHGGDPATALHLVVPSLPGYGLSGPTTETGWGSTRVARAWIELMTWLGYDRFGAQGGDWGSWISREIGVLAPDRVVGVHTNGMITFPVGAPGEFDGLSDADRERLAFGEHYQRELYGFKLIQSSRPAALAYALTDSPAGLLGWTMSVLKEWTDCVDSPEEAIARDRILANVTLWWLTATAGSAARSFVETPDNPDQADLETEVRPTSVPTGVAVFPRDVLRPVRRFAERDHRAIVRWTEHDRGGTFAAAEEPDLFTADVRAFFALVR
ncbi:epoxide hydrolase family protein [Umezawaea beigongshangensis]|uniref:epoxide hydrolase family protein n=1 Tax=Umezawaea beigongshangensis TaxID=2780383 RepID=UPI0018F19845|nr:epoxide hydrolase family protein [Umezawaea beigongshangensis]